MSLRLQLHARVRRPATVGFTRHHASDSLQAVTTGCAGLAHDSDSPSTTTPAPDRRRLSRRAGRQITRRVAEHEHQPPCCSAPSAALVGPHRAGTRRADTLPITPLSSIWNITPRTMPTTPPAVTVGDSISRRAACRLASSKRLTGGGSAASRGARGAPRESAAPAG
jgi:hypothetical protein